MVPVNYLAVLFGAISNMVIGFLWYGPFFGKIWSKEMGWTSEAMASMKARGGMGKSYVLMAIGALVMAWVLAHAIVFSSAYMQMAGFSSGLITGFMSWLGFIAPVTLGSILWEGRSWKLWFINNCYWLVSLLVMGMILGKMM